MISFNGMTGMTLFEGYSALSTDAYTVFRLSSILSASQPDIPVTQDTTHGGKITWNNATKKLDIASGLAKGTYTVVLTASSGAASTATLTFTLTVTDVTTPPDITGTSGMMVTVGYEPTSTEAYTILGSPTPTVNKSSGNAAITWNNAGRRLIIAAGLAVGTYDVVLVAENSVGESELVFTLTVTAEDVSEPIITEEEEEPAEEPDTAEELDTTEEPDTSGELGIPGEAELTTTPSTGEDTNSTPSTPVAAKNVISMRIGDQYMMVNGVRQEIDPGRGTVPIIINSRTLLPIRAIVEAMGGTISWDEETRTITLAANGHSVTMWMDRTNIVVDGISMTMDVAPVSINDRTMVPVRFAAENLGCEVAWIADNNEVIITY